MLPSPCHLMNYNVQTFQCKGITGQDKISQECTDILNLTHAKVERYHIATPNQVLAVVESRPSKSLAVCSKCGSNIFMTLLSQEATSSVIHMLI